MAVKRLSEKPSYWSRHVGQAEGKWVHQIIIPLNHKNSAFFFFQVFLEHSSDYLLEALYI